MNEKNPDAFPKSNSIKGYEGMTLRDYFAVHVLQGIISNSRVNDIGDKEIKAAFKMADHMLEERNKKT